MGVISGNRHSKARQATLKLHRLAEFERVFSLYLEGKTTAQHVTNRAKAMLAAGLPRLR
jgi:hypothetical protein